jgi:hypothetical protein
MDLFRTYHQLRCIMGDRGISELTDFLIVKQKAVADLWNTILDREEGEKIFRAYRKEHLSDKELLNQVINDARSLLGAMRDLEKRIKQSLEPSRPLRVRRRRKLKQPVSAKGAPDQSLVSP